MTETPTIYDISSPGRIGIPMPECDVPETALPEAFLRSELDLPEVGELQVVRHFVTLSKKNYSIDSGFYPLGSCTMKYNPKINEDVARLAGFAQLHPLTDPEGSQGALALMYQLQEWLSEIAGFAGATLVPAAGAQGEFAGILMIHKYHQERGDTQRTKILVPNSAHGTNPATASMVGLEVVETPSNDQGNVDIEALRALCDDTVAGMMITVPSTLGLFDSNILEIVELVHGCGGLLYMDGANMNSLMGIVKPAELGFDVMHYNLHKTFSTPHGGGGPGCGAVAVNEKLLPYLPGPIVQITEIDEDDVPFYDLVTPEKSIGQLKAFWGNFGMHVRAYAYISTYGGRGLREVSNYAVLNANYIRAKLQDAYHIPYNRYCGHEFVLEGHWKEAEGVHALDISKRLMDYGFHPPTNYFPLIVPEALLIEPTETEDIETLNSFIDAMLKIAEEAHTQPELLKEAPHVTPVGRVDEVRAAKQLVLCCRPIPEWDHSAEA